LIGIPIQPTREVSSARTYGQKSASNSRLDLAGVLFDNLHDTENSRKCPGRSVGAVIGDTDIELAFEVPGNRVIQIAAGVLQREGEVVALGQRRWYGPHCAAVMHLRLGHQ
jgi:hypothetical protein